MSLKGEVLATLLATNKWVFDKISADSDYLDRLEMRLADILNQDYEVGQHEEADLRNIFEMEDDVEDQMPF